MSLAARFAARRGPFSIAVAIFLLDQASKIVADVWLKGAGPVKVIPGFFNFWYSRNRGGLFGLFAAWDDPWRAVLLTAFPLAAVLLLIVFLLTTDETDRWPLVALSLILGGAAGNLLDRIVRGSVVDFLDVYASHPGLAEWLVSRFGTPHWPTFNLADSAIVTGTTLLLLDVVLPKHWRPFGRRAAE